MATSQENISNTRSLIIQPNLNKEVSCITMKWGDLQT